MKLCLGTVQFGMKYGINNAIGRQPSKEEVFDMLHYAIQNGIDAFDTSSAYGESEKLLGDFFYTNSIQRDNYHVFSKFYVPNDKVKKNKGDLVKTECEKSLKNLKVDYIDAYILHVASDVYDKGVVDALLSLKEDGIVRRVGISLYGLKEGWYAIDIEGLDFVQMPYSILDQRGISEGFFSRAKENNYIIAVRSVFLQGLLQMREEKIPDSIKDIVPYIRKIKTILKKYEIGDLTQACISFVKAEELIDYLVFGADTIDQMKEDINIFNVSTMPINCVNELKRTIRNMDERMLFPSSWSI